MIKKLNNI